jgi:DHA2 family methylenomycin A resistance protein-like MFS transporter
LVAKRRPRTKNDHPRTKDDHRCRAVEIAGGLLMGAGLAALLILGASTPYLAIVAQLTAIGLGLGLAVPVMTSSRLGSVDASMSGVASGTLDTARQTGSVIGVALFGALVGSDPIHGLHVAIAISIGLSLAVVALARLIRTDDS